MASVKMNRRLRVAFISHSSGARGAERALLEAIDSLQSYSLEPFVFVPGSGPFVDELQARGISYATYMGIPWVTNRRTIWRTIGKSIMRLPQVAMLARQLRDQSCELVYSNSIAVSIGAMSSALIRLPHVWHIHEFGQDDHGFVFDYGLWAARLLFDRFGGYYIMNSFAVANEMNQLMNISNFSARHRVIYQSVTLRSSPSVSYFSESDSRKLILVGALHEGKGQMDAIVALKHLADEGIATELLLIGDGSFRPQLQQAVAELGLQDRVHFVGFVDDVAGWYAIADIALVCSRKEAFGRVAVEGMLSRVPVIVANTGGLTEIVEDSYSGLYYEPGNVADLANKIKLLLLNPMYSAQLVENAFARANARFSKERYAQELFETLLAVRTMREHT